MSNRIRLGLSLGMLLVAAGLGGCKQGSTSSKGTAPSASASAGAVASGPCAEYAAKLCDKAGKESSSCQSITAASEIMPVAACTAALKEVDYSLTKISEKRKACDELVNKLCAELGPKTETCTMVKTQTKQFPPERCTMMMQHYAEIIADLRKMQDGNKPLPPESQAALVAGNAPAFGPANAKVTVVEFSDFECPYCSRAADVLHQIREKYGDRVRVVFRQFPLSFHKNAHDAAEASLAAHAQGKFWPYHDLLFKNQQQLDRAALEGYAKQTGLDVAKFKKALDEDTYSAAVDAEMKMGEQVRVEGTPTMFVNGARVTNPTDFSAVSAMIETALNGGAPG
jgi:protein-disulfide isomerase